LQLVSQLVVLNLVASNTNRLNFAYNGGN
jgi:hypothetical protein